MKQARLTWGAGWALLALGMGSGLARGQERDSLRIRMTRLELDVTVHYGDGTLEGAARLSFENPTARAVTEVPLQVHRLMTIARVTDGDGAELPFDQDVVRYGDSPRRQVTQAWVRLPRPLPPGGTGRLAVRWAGVLWGYTETGSLYIRDRVDSAFTILREDALAFPLPGVPSWRSNRAGPRGEFSFEARVTVPRGQVVAAGGGLRGRSDRDSLTTWTYGSDDPVPFLNVAIAPYRVLAEGDLRVHYFPEDSAGAAMVMNAIGGAVRRLTAWFGPLGRELRLSVMEIPEGFGSQASLGAGIIMDARAFRDRSALSQLYHELTHLWNAPDTERPSPRWNEGLATFLENRLAHELDGWTGMDEHVVRTVDWLLPRYARDATNLTTPFIDYGRAGKTDLAYTVGFLMFYQLHQLLGAEGFDRAIGGWYQERRERGGTTDEFVRSVKRSAGIPLDRFFDDWVYTTRWYQRLSAGETPRQMVDSYRGGPRPRSP
jgi:hypothetical protein